MFKVIIGSKSQLYYKDYDVLGDHSQQELLQLYYKEFDVLGDHSQQELAVLQGV